MALFNALPGASKISTSHQNYKRAFWILILSLSVVRLVVAGRTELAEDEAYYWLWARDLQLSYFDHPAMVAYWIAAGVAVLGKTELGVRLLAVLAAIPTSWLIYDSARLAFGSPRTAFWSVFWVNATILFGVGSVLMTPDAPLLLFWMLVLWAVLKLVTTGKGSWWLVAGVGLGLGMLSKYTMALIVPGALLTTLIYPRLRYWWRTPYPYAAALLAFVVSSPILIWNLRHHWASFDKQWTHAFGQDHPEPLKWFGEFLGSQAGLITPFLFLFCLWGMGWSLWAGWRRGEPRWFMLGAVSLPIFLFFLEHTLSGSVQAHWAGPAYFGGLIATVGGFMETESRHTVNAPLRGLFWFAPWFAMAMTLMVYVQALHPFLPLAESKDPTHRLAGWTQLAPHLDQLRRVHPDAFLFTSSHNITGVLSFYSAGHPKVFETHNRIRYPYIHDRDIAALPGRSGIYVTKLEESRAAEMAPHFGQWSVGQPVDLKRNGKVFARYEIFVGTDYRGGLFE